MQTTSDVIAKPNIPITQHCYITIAGAEFPLSVVSHELEEGFNQTFRAEIVITSPNFAISGSDSIGRWGIFCIDAEVSPGAWAAPEISTLRTVHGVVTQWEHVSSSADEATYRLRLEPRFAMLKQTTDSRVFLNTTLKDLLKESIVDRKYFEHWDVEFTLEAAEQGFEQVLMYEETVENFVARHCRKAGIYYYFKHEEGRRGARRDTLVFGDSSKGYMRALEVPVLEPGGMTGVGQESIFTLRTIRTTVAETISVRDHNYRTPDDPLLAEVSIAHEDRSVCGTIRRGNEHQATAADGLVLANLRRDEQIARQTIYRGTSNVVRMMPGMVVRLTNHALPDAQYGIVITKVVSRCGRSQPFENEFEAMPSHLPYRPEYDPHQHWRWMPGPIKATIESRHDDGYAHPDDRGRYYLKFGFDWRKTKPGFSSKALLLLRPTASYRGGFHAPKLPGTEVKVAFTGADIDRPFILGAVHDYTRTDTVYDLDGWHTRSVWRTPLLGADIRMEDYKDHEGIKSATIFAKSSVSLGCLVDGDKKKRGEGFEAVTQGWATVRGAKGVLVSADGLSHPGAPHLEMQAALAQLQSALTRVTALADATLAAHAESADKATQAGLKDTLAQLKDAGLIASAPAGIALATPRSIQHAAGDNVMVSAGKHVDVSAMKRFTLAAGDLISLCAHKLGLKLFAAKGKIEIQAQSDGLDLLASKQVHIASADADVLIAGGSKTAMTSGGAYFTMEGGSVVFNCPGDFKINAASFSFDGPASFKLPSPSFPKSDFKPTDFYNMTH